MKSTNYKQALYCADYYCKNIKKTTAELIIIEKNYKVMNHDEIEQVCDRGAVNENKLIIMESSSKHKNTKESKKKQKNQKVPKNKITPEFIEEQKRLAKLRKEEKINKLHAAGYSDEDIANLKNQITKEDSSFIKRPILTHKSAVLDLNPADSGSRKLHLKIMTYNLLAQSLIRRSLFPTSGEALKWHKRSIVLLRELKYYDCDILCLQEVDYIQFENFWKLEFDKLNYHANYYRFESKNHGVAIIYKKDKFKRALLEKNYHYDEILSGDIKPRTETKNVGMILTIPFADEVKSEKEGIIIGTHHLFWHPNGTFERTRQTYCTLKSFQDFMIENNYDSKQYFQFFCGDFNAEPYHSPYLSITRKPVYYDDVCKTVIEDSITEIFQDDPDHQLDSMEEGLENSSSEKKYTVAAEGAPKGVPTKKLSHVDNRLIEELIDLHNKVPKRAISLYSVGYKHFHPENSMFRNEPDFSNWAHTWSGLLDYIFVLSDWDMVSNKQKVDELEELHSNCGILLKGLLRMPLRSEMSKLGQPRTGEYGSDHLCMIAVVQLD